MFHWSIAVALVLTASMGVTSVADAQSSVALPTIKGPRRASPAKLSDGIEAALKAEGIRLVQGEDLDGSNVAAAKSAGADFLLSVKITRSRKKYFAKAQLVSVESGKTVKRLTSSYRRANEAEKTGRSMGGELAAVIRAAAPPPPPPPPPPPEIVRAPPPPPPPAVVPKDEAPSGSASKRVEPESPGGSAEDKVLRISVGAGTQIASAYTVAVGSDVTGLAYSLSPLILIGGGARVAIPGIGLGFEADVSIVPVKYAIDVEPQVSPREPGGLFLNFGARAFYELLVTRFGASNEGAFSIVPKLGVGYGSLSVESQGENTVVVSYNALALEAGLGFGIRVNESLAFDAQAMGGLVLSYSEDPVTTGADGGGLRLRFGGGARYWLSGAFGVYLGAGYEFQRVGLSGGGTRTRFVDDPELVDASVFSGDLKVGTGVLLAL